jgi:hypothetical protein
MANLPISQLPSASILSGAEIFPLVQNGVTKQCSFAQITSGSYEANSHYASLYHTASMFITTPSVYYSMSFNTVDFANGVTVANPHQSYITFANPGVYDLQFSAQITKTSGTKSNVFIWLRQNGSDVPNTNTDVTLAGGSGDRVVAAWNFFIKTTAANETAQLMYGGTVGNVELLYDTSSIGPSIPSVIATINRVG